MDNIILVVKIIARRSWWRAADYCRPRQLAAAAWCALLPLAANFYREFRYWCPFVEIAVWLRQREIFGPRKSEVRGESTLPLRSWRVERYDNLFNEKYLNISCVNIKRCADETEFSSKLLLKIHESREYFHQEIIYFVFCKNKSWNYNIIHLDYLLGASNQIMSTGNCERPAEVSGCVTRDYTARRK